MSVTPLYDKTTPDTSRGLTGGLWRQSLEAYVSNNPAYGTRLQTDFINENLKTSDGTTNQITGTTTATHAEGWIGQDAGVAGGTYTIARVAGPDGFIRLSNGTGTADFGCELGRTVADVPLITHTTAATRRGRVVMECRITNVDADRFFMGLTSIAATTPLSAIGNTFADAGYCGIHVQNDGAVTFVSKSAAAGTSDSATLISAADFGTFAGSSHKLGFAINWQPTGTSVDVFIDGQWYKPAAMAIDPLSLPVATCAPRLFITSGDSGVAPDCDIDSIDLFVEGNVG